MPRGPPVRGPGTGGVRRRARTCADAGRALERWLLATGESWLEPATLELLRSQMDG
jgi:hypothetical protein